MQLEPRKWIDSLVEAIPGVIGTVRFGSTSTNPKPANLAIQWGKTPMFRTRLQGTTFHLPHCSKEHRDSNAFHLNIYVVLVLLNAGDSQT
jgi:hypothetical protein